MRRSQELALKQSEARQRLNAAIEKRNAIGAGEDVPAELVKELDDASKALSTLEVEYRAAAVQEDAEDEAARRDNPDAEYRERTDLIRRASIVPFLIEAARGVELDGVEAECRQSLLGDQTRPGLIPVELLEVRQAAEVRQDVVTPIADAAATPGTQASVLARVFTRSIAARLLVDMPAVPVGSANYPVMTDGTSASMLARDAAIEAKAAAFTGETLDPTRLSARYLFRIEDVYKLRGFEEILRRDLSAVLTDEMDRQIIQGDGNAPHVQGFYHALEAPALDDAATDFGGVQGKYASMVDGLNAYTLSDLRSVIGGKTFAYMNGLYRTPTSDESALDHVRSRTGGVSVSSRILDPGVYGANAAAKAKAQEAIVALTSYPGRNAVAPIWRAVEVIRDNITGAAKGQIAITALMLWNFKVVRKTGFRLISVRHTA